MLSSQQRVDCLSSSLSKDHSHHPEGSQAVLALSSLLETIETVMAEQACLENNVYMFINAGLLSIYCVLMGLATSPHYELILMTPRGGVMCPIIIVSM